MRESCGGLNGRRIGASGPNTESSRVGPFCGPGILFIGMSRAPPFAGRFATKPWRSLYRYALRMHGSRRCTCKTVRPFASFGRLERARASLALSMPLRKATAVVPLLGIGEGSLRVRFVTMRRIERKTSWVTGDAEGRSSLDEGRLVC